MATTNINITVGLMGVPSVEIMFEAPVTVREAIERAGFMNDAKDKKIKMRDRDSSSDNYVTMDTLLYNDCYILVTKEIKGSKEVKLPKVKVSRSAIA